MQFDLYLPEGIEVVARDDDNYNVELGNRTTSEQHIAPLAAMQTDGALRVLTYSGTNIPFNDTAGNVITLNVKADNDIEERTYELGIKNIVLADTGATKIRPANHIAEIAVDNGTTSIEIIIIENTSTANDYNAVYDLRGVKVFETIKGNIYIKGNNKFIAH